MNKIAPRPSPSFNIQTSPSMTSAHATHDGTCLYVRFHGVQAEFFNAEPYESTELALAQADASEYFGVDVSHTVFVTRAPKKVTAEALALIGFVQHILELSADIAQREDSPLIVDGGKLA